MECSKIRTFLTYGHPLVPCCPDKRGICMRDTIETAFNICGTHYHKISGTSGKNHFHEMNGDIGMAGWK